MKTCENCRKNFKNLGAHRRFCKGETPTETPQMEELSIFEKIKRKFQK